MIRYSRGLRRKALSAVSLARTRARQAIGVTRGWRVHRPPVDHTLYEVDNEELGDVVPALATVEHRVSWQRELERPSIVEFEHGFALVGHTDDRTDYGTFIGELPARLSRFLRWYDPERHRLIGCTDGASRSARELFGRFGRPAPQVETVRWVSRSTRARLARVDGRLEVFHYGGAFPYTKGTHELIAAAKLLPDVRFRVSVDPRSEVVRGNVPRNVEVLPMHDKSAYMRAMNRAHVVAHPVFADGWGVVVEALARAIPLVAYDTYDKAEAVRDGESGRLLSADRELSFYDAFFEGRWRNWTDYGNAVRDGVSTERVERLAAALGAYDADRALLLRHSLGAARQHAERHAPGLRLTRFAQLYDELVAVADGGGAR